MRIISFATTNEYKVKFANNLLKDFDWKCIPAKVSLIEPQSKTQEEISIYKVKQAYEQLKSPVITMDSGIFINGLNGFPGIYTADVYKELTSAQIVKMLENVPDKTAYIQQTLSYSDNETIKTFSYKSDGVIVSFDEMVSGYAFDSFFKPNSVNKLMAELTENEKSIVWGEPWKELGDFLNQKHK